MHFILIIINVKHIQILNNSASYAIFFRKVCLAEEKNALHRQFTQADTGVTLQFRYGIKSIIW